MSIADYVKRAEECERLAAECQTDSNRAILLYALVAGDRWLKKRAAPTTDLNVWLSESGRKRPNIRSERRVSAARWRSCRTLKRLRAVSSLT